MPEILLDYDDSFTVNIVANVTFQFILKKAEQFLFKDIYRFSFFFCEIQRYSVCTIHLKTSFLRLFDPADSARNK